MVHHFRDGTDAWEEALNFAQETCLIIFEQRYPFDVSFEVWATKILKNLILARYTRGKDILDRRQRLESLDAETSEGGDSLQEVTPDTRSLVPFEKIENQTLLLNAMAQLSPIQRQVIQDTFLRELDDAQIARRLGKSKQAVYNLRHRALARLQQILARQPAPQEKGRKMH
jgi:RNA polymerase sigma factor (sigma-70 family)